MSNTLSSLFDFIPNTKAKSRQVDINFELWRGDWIPIETDTAAASDLKHDLGSTDHRWNNLYIDDVLFSDVTTSGMLISGDSGGAAINIRVGNTIAAEITPTGIPISSIRPRGVTQGSGSTPDDFVRSGAFVSPGITATAVAIGTINFVRSGRRPVRIGLMGPTTANDVGIEVSATGAENLIVNLLRDSVTITSWEHRFSVASQSSTNHSHALPPGSFYYFDFSLSAGTATYQITARTQNTNIQAAVKNIYVYAYEVF